MKIDKTMEIGIELLLGLLTNEKTYMTFEQNEEGKVNFSFSNSIVNGKTNIRIIDLINELKEMPINEIKKMFEDNDKITMFIIKHSQTYDSNVILGRLLQVLKEERKH